MAGKRGAPFGNQNSVKNKPWSDAIKRALAKRAKGALSQKEALDDLAEKFLCSVESGESGIPGWREFGDRFEGKVQDQIAMEHSGALTIEIVRFGEK